MATTKVAGDSSGTVRFVAMLEQASGKNATDIVIPDHVIEALAAGKRPAVQASLNGHEFRTTVGVTRGRDPS